ncbi:hypothetical protein J6590_024119, partial [Homalodisca vitripennis]
MFLLSLIPELEELSDLQIELFKRHVLRVVYVYLLEHHQTKVIRTNTVNTHLSNDVRLKRVANKRYSRTLEFFKGSSNKDEDS